MASDWLQAQEKAAKTLNKKVADHKPSPQELPEGKAKVRAIREGLYGGQLRQPGDVFTIDKCKREFPRAKAAQSRTVVIGGERFTALYDDNWMEFLGSIKFDEEGNEIFLEYHGEPAIAGAGGPGLLQRAKDMISGGGDKNGQGGAGKPGDKV